MKTIILTSYDKETKVTVEDDIRVRSVGQHGIVAFEKVTGRHYDDNNLIALVANIDLAYEEGTSIQVRTTVPGVPSNKGEWKDV